MLGSTEITPQKKLLYSRPDESPGAPVPRYSADFTSGIMAKSNGFDAAKFCRSTSDLPTMRDTTPKRDESFTLKREEPMESTSPQSHPYICGDNIGSVPDLGFGLRAFLASLGPPQNHGKNHNLDTPSKLPINEEPCIKKYYYSTNDAAAEGNFVETPISAWVIFRTHLCFIIFNSVQNKWIYFTKLKKKQSHWMSSVLNIANSRSKRLLDFNQQTTPVRSGESFIKRPSAFVPVTAEAVNRVAGSNHLNLDFPSKI